MIRHSVFCFSALAAGGVLLHVAGVWGQSPEAPTPVTREVNRVPVPALGEQPLAPPAAAKPAAPHPLQPVLDFAKATLPGIARLRDYSATLMVREWDSESGVLGDYERLALKVRHRPFSVHIKFLGPARLVGQEAFYIRGENDGNMLAHRPNGRALLPVAPTGQVAMKGRHYPLTEVGLLNLAQRLIDVVKTDMQYAECEVKYWPDAKVNGRACTCIQVMHPTPRRHFLFYVARVYVDDELKLPIRYEAYAWPTAEQPQPHLIEEYTYCDLRLNNGFGDQEFRGNRGVR